MAQNDTNEAMYGLNGGINSGFMYWKSTRENLVLINDIIKGECCLFVYDGSGKIELKQRISQQSNLPLQNSPSILVD